MPDNYDILLSMIINAICPATAHNSEPISGVISNVSTLASFCDL